MTVDEDHKRLSPEFEKSCCESYVHRLINNLEVRTSCEEQTLEQKILRRGETSGKLLTAAVVVEENPSMSARS